ncbi:MAG TPA: hypothetical protein VN681_08845 [Stellaceae bacterium]|nr:hypothetical protein [Stellaceae bacterium]
MPASPSLLTIQLLSWLAARPRSHAELKDAWRSTCPSTCAWEDAFTDGLVALAAGSERAAGARVVLTPRGRAALAAAEAPPPPARPFSLDPARAKL